MHQPQYQDKRQVLNKAYVLETIVRNRIKDSIFYKQFLYLTNEQTILPVIVNQVKYIGGLDANNRPAPFLCCLLRLLEIQPSPKIVSLYLSKPEFKYLTCLTLMYVRMTSTAAEVYSVFDNYVTNYAKVRTQLVTPQIRNGIAINFGLTYIDEFADDLLVKDRCLGVILPLLEPRSKLVDQGVAERHYHVTSLGSDSAEDEEDEFVSDSD